MARKKTQKKGLTKRQKELFNLTPKVHRQDLNTSETVVLGRLIELSGLQFSKENGYFFRSNSDLSHDCGYDEKTIRNAVETLMEGQFISCEKGSRKKVSQNPTENSDSHEVICENSPLKSPKSMATQYRLLEKVSGWIMETSDNENDISKKSPLEVPHNEGGVFEQKVPTEYNINNTSNSNVSNSNVYRENSSKEFSHLYVLNNNIPEDLTRTREGDMLEKRNSVCGSIVDAPTLMKGLETENENASENETIQNETIPNVISHSESVSNHTIPSETISFEELEQHTSNTSHASATKTYLPPCPPSSLNAEENAISDTLTDEVVQETTDNAIASPASPETPKKDVYSSINSAVLTNDGFRHVYKECMREWQMRSTYDGQFPNWYTQAYFDMLKSEGVDIPFHAAIGMPMRGTHPDEKIAYWLNQMKPYRDAGFGTVEEWQKYDRRYREMCEFRKFHSMTDRIIPKLKGWLDKDYINDVEREILKKKLQRIEEYRNGPNIWICLHPFFKQGTTWTEYVRIVSLIQDKFKI